MSCFNVLLLRVEHAGEDGDIGFALFNRLEAANIEARFDIAILAWRDVLPYHVTVVDLAEEKNNMMLTPAPLAVIPNFTDGIYAA
jgi:hypothetical protein